MSFGDSGGEAVGRNAALRELGERKQQRGERKQQGKINCAGRGGRGQS